MIHHTTPDDSGKYVCIATNPFGKDETVVQLLVQGRNQLLQENIVVTDRHKVYMLPVNNDSLIHLFIFLLLPLEHRASMKHLISLQFLNL
jgi:hypothetical protein